MSDLGWNVWGAAAGVIGTILALLPFFTVWLYRRLPYKRLPGLVALMEETHSLFRVALRDGLITDESELAPLRINILSAIIRYERIRTKIIAEDSFTENVKNWWNGLSRRMYSLEKELNTLRIKLAKRTSKEREKRASQGLTAGLLFFSDKQIQENNDSAVLEDPIWPSGASAASTEDALCQPKLANLHRPAQAYRSTHHTISDSDLQSLLLLALAPHLQTDEGKPQRARKRAALRLLSNQLCARSGDARCLKRTSKRSTGFRSLTRILRRVYGVNPPGVGEAAREALVDPESLLVPCTEGDDDDDAGWDSDND